MTAPLSAELSRWVIIPILLVFFAGELVWREREAGLGEITDAMPGSEWALFLGKFLGLGLVLVVFMALLTTAGMLAQVILLWVRGRESGLRVRLRLARSRFTPSTARAAAAAVGLILTLGGFIFYNTNVLNEYAALTDIEEKKGRIVALLGGHGDIEVQAHCKPDGVVTLKAVAISGFRTVRVPRVWDSPERREAERDPRDELGRVARRFKTALDDWTKSVSALATWIRYSPPPPGAKPVEPWFDDQSEEDDDGGPETTH